MTARILIVEDEKLIRWSLRQKFEACGYTVDEVEDGKAALEVFNPDTHDLIMLDYRLPDSTGLEVLTRIRETNNDVVVIMMTAYSTVENAVDAMKLGAYDYIAKPFAMDHVLRTVEKALETTQLRREVRELRHHLRHEYGFDRVIGRHPSMLKLFDIVRDVAQGNATTVFLRGETGTGKDLIARVIHFNSARSPRPFMNITCTAISETLLESELFGHERGAFTDAKMQKKGLFELADGGTVFLDEVGDMPAPLQGKLLRFLEEHTFRRVGGTEEIHVDVRVIAASNRDIEQAIEEGSFRSDLFYRINVIAIDLPPLRERRDDVRLLAQFYVSTFAQEFKRNVTAIAPAAYEKLLAYSWPGNVRELRNVCERAVLLGKEEQIGPHDIILGREVPSGDRSNVGGFTLPTDGIDFEQLERSLIKQALERSGQNKAAAARLLGISKDTLRYRIEKHKLPG